MNIILIAYEAKQPNLNYRQVFDAIMECGSGWWHYLGSVWIVHTEKSANQCYDIISPKIAPDDNLFIVDITGREKVGWLPSRAWEWIKNKENKKITTL